MGGGVWPSGGRGLAEWAGVWAGGGRGLGQGPRSTLSLTLPTPQHLYIWLASEKAHERQRAVHSCVILLKFLNHKGNLDVSMRFTSPTLRAGFYGWASCPGWQGPSQSRPPPRSCQGS